MTKEERDALIDATAEQCAKIAREFHEQIDPKDGSAAGIVRRTGLMIANEIMKQMRRP